MTSDEFDRYILRELIDHVQANASNAAEQAAVEERAAIVAWLRGRSGYGPMADDIERGEHRREEKP